jgi:hypothetical protein
MTKIFRRTHVRMDEMKVDLGREKLEEDKGTKARMKLKEDEGILRRQLCTQGFSLLLGGWLFKECGKSKEELIFLGLLHCMSIEWKFFFLYL